MKEIIEVERFYRNGIDYIILLCKENGVYSTEIYEPSKIKERFSDTDKNALLERTRGRIDVQQDIDRFDNK